MQFVKGHWISLACGLVTLLAITFGVLGMLSDSVVQEMEKVKQSANEIAGLRGDPQNEATINAEKERGQKFKQEYDTVVSAAESINIRKPLLDGVFPTAPYELQFRFKEVYTRRIGELPKLMDAGDLPNNQEILDEVEVLAEVARRKAAEEGRDEPGQKGPPGAGGPGLPPFGRGEPGRTAQETPGGAAREMGRGGPPGQEGVGAQTAGPTAALPAGVTQEDVRRRAAAKKARVIRMYAAPTSFHVSPLAQAEGAPPPKEMWYAQVGLWIQEDLAKAVARVNDEAAQARPPSEANVTTLPVKRLEGVRIAGYVTSTGTVVAFPALAGTERQSAAGPAGASGPSFTGRKSDNQFDVLRFTLTVIVDERELFKLVDAITRQNFYQLIGLNHEVTDSSDSAGHYYGEAPVVRATLDFEGYFARRLFKELMPKDVQAELGAAEETGQKRPPGGGGRRPGQAG